MWEQPPPAVRRAQPGAFLNLKNGLTGFLHRCNPR
jgi:hypothetical protein